MLIIYYLIKWLYYQYPFNKYILKVAISIDNKDYQAYIPSKSFVAIVKTNK